MVRDYKNHPLKRGELIPKEDLQYVYFELNLSRPEAGRYFGVGEAVVKRSLKVYGMKKPSSLGQLKSTATCLKKYGTKTPLQNKEILDKTRQTTKSKYGVDNVFKLKSMQQTIRQTNTKKYGTPCVLQNPTVRAKAMQTLKKKYNIISANQINIHNADIWNDDTKFISLVKSGNNGHKWYTSDLAKFFNLTISPVQVKLGKFNLWSYIDYHTSAAEREIFAYIQSLGFAPIKFKIENTEFDIYIPELKIAIEYNGNYWHSTAVRSDYLYHYKKSQLAEQNGIFLYHIFEYDWYAKKDKVINQLNNLLHKNNNKIFARNCIVKQVDKKEAYKFLDANHIQGRTASSVNLGLYNNNQLVALMTFGKSRFNKHVTWELVRFCNLAGYTIPGGASKLFKYFIKIKDPDSIVSYSDIARTKGGLYNLLGFTQTHINEPNYIWVHHNTVLSRYQCQKHRLIKSGFGSLGKTEVEIMKKRCFAQIFDCGSRTHVWKRG